MPALTQRVDTQNLLVNSHFGPKKCDWIHITNRNTSAIVQWYHGSNLSYLVLQLTATWPLMPVPV